MSLYSYAKQVRFVLLVECLILGVAFLISYSFWSNVCDSSLASCLGEGGFSVNIWFVIFSIIRPFTFTPMLFMALLAGKTFSFPVAVLVTVISALLSCMVVFFLAKLIGNRMAKPWLRANLPATFNFIRSQDYKVVFAARLIPIIPFDLLSLAFGALDFRTKSVLIASVFGVIPEAYLFCRLVDPNETLLSNTLATLVTFGLGVLVPLLMFEVISSRRGKSMWQMSKAMYKELKYEVQTNNQIVKRHAFDPTKIPVLLLYGFFSSRRSLTVIERMLMARGHQVFSFNLGGFFGTFFTRGIIETASFIDYKLKRQMERHNFDRLHIVAHSKGGLVALWWALNMGGSQYCKKIVTMGTPWRGSRLTWLALITPLGFIWQDVWQMRPGSAFVNSMLDIEFRDDLHLYCMHSINDRVAKGESAVFKPKKKTKNIHAVPMNHITHFEFLYRRDVGDTISAILNTIESPATQTISDPKPDSQLA